MKKEKKDRNKQTNRKRMKIDLGIYGTPWVGDIYVYVYHRDSKKRRER